MCRNRIFDLTGNGEAESNRIKISKTVLSLLMTGAVILSGCGSDKDVTTVTVSKNGEITSDLVEDFDKDKYSIDDLDKTISEEVSKYNSANGADSVDAEKPKMKGDKTVCEKITFSSYRDYAGFNNSQFFCGTVSDALALGYDLGISLKDVKDSSKTMTGDEVASEMKDKHILIIDEPLHVITYGKILYISDGVTSSGGKEADISKDMDGTGYIVFE